MKKIINKISLISKSNSYWNLWVLIIPFMVICFYLYRKDISIKKGNYTTGYIIKIYRGSRTKNIMFSYKVKNKEITSSNAYIDKYKPQLGKRYLVQYSLKYNFGGANVFQGIPIPDSIKEAPPEGWKELPKWAKKVKK